MGVLKQREEGRARLLNRNRLFVGCQWAVPMGGDRIEVVSPATEEALGSVPRPTNEDGARAVEAARAARDSYVWAETSPEVRAELLESVMTEIEARKDEFSWLFSLESGAPITVSQGLTAVAVGAWRDYARICRTYPFIEARAEGVEVVQEPVGVVAGIAPWNAPLAGVSLMMAPALAAGCPVVLKPAPEAPLAMYLLAEVIEAAGVPEGLVSILPAGRGFGEYLVSHPDVDKISLTGSAVAGRRVMQLAADRIARVTLELGGKSPAIVADDADLDSVVPILVTGGLGLSGQVCLALTRVLVSATRHDELVERLAASFSAMRIGDPMDPDTQLGPLALQRQRDRVEGYIALARDEGARIVVGGGRPEGLDRGWYIEPTLLAGVSNTMRVAREEIFGPVISVIPYTDLDDAVRIANDSDYGLIASVFTNDPSSGRFLARRLRAGQIHLNGYGTCPGHPFGGFKRSGVGRKGGPEGLEAYLEPKLVQTHGIR